MRFNITSPVTLYHYDEEKDVEREYFFPKAKVHGTTKIGDLSHGRRTQNEHIVRIFTDDKIEVACGDKVFSEGFNEKLTVVGFADNRRGSKRIRHFKLIVK